jgi:hypothetical protein
VSTNFTTRAGAVDCDAVPRGAAGGARQGLPLRRSMLRIDSAAVLALGSHRVTHFTRCARCVQTDAMSQFTKRARTRADPNTALLAAPEVAPAGHRLPRGQFNAPLKAMAVTRFCVLATDQSLKPIIAPRLFPTGSNMSMNSQPDSTMRQKLIDALVHSDASRRLGRAKRIEWISVNRRPLGGMAGRSQILALHGEAIHCYIDGRFVATTLAATAFVEQTIVDTLLALGRTSDVQMGAQDALDQAAKFGLLRPGLVRRVRALIKRRNAYAHLKILTNRYSFDRRFWAAKVHPDRLRESDAKKALQVMDAVLHATLT